MKILIYGAGVIGCTYGWQLSQAGHDITMLVRQGKKQQLAESGIDIYCTDFRGSEKRIIETVFRPDIIEELSPQNDFEYIIVSVNCIHLKEILPVLSASVGKAHILFFQNIWDDFDEIAKYLSTEKYFFGFPFMVGGGRNDGSINSVISGLKYSHTPLGEVSGAITPRLQKIAEVLKNANLKPIVSTQIKIWLITHYAIAASLSAGIMSAGGGKLFANNPQIVRETIQSIREGFTICSKRGIDPKTEKANKLYYLPLFISVPIARKVYKDEALCLMFDGHTLHSPQEIKKMLRDILDYGQMYGVDMPYSRKLQKSII